MTNLESLQITNGKHFNEGHFRVLVDLPKLTDLDLSEVDRVTDESLVTISNISGLTRLCLNGCRAITDDGVSALTALRDLQSLEIRDCDKVSEAAVNDLQNKLPVVVEIQSGKSPGGCSIS
ncbi:hypothetical protein COCSUDRAFT_55082 [Coccomyxa subellipsoidea C-169]|uniref:F-box/LRR-repeat protein 15-like leucin rich repeat domain-containing protein n=1 Tax=Coccomyxa subellipsoidea (strain C-169) TaxID=574566 RepID=I0Z8T6_COCSC|nr:hypothetical protein COCSUDRAFT_55082 [Coccomyxa subellipsoidea C-169]EIE27055.1 hypothetical protein COCSUDRAFT_55082 [Coccomyxa subellipsoidea C-169]|eukprot:XP_005651599.1 hypothetical protein COCSUDRAFT_55082 [Coccomyxa subellipsoidea C-169]